MTQLYRLSFKDSCFAFVLLIIIQSLFSNVAEADGLGGSETITSSLPNEFQGQYPIHMPELKGVEQLLVLSDRWVIVVSHKMQELYDEIDKQSNGELDKLVKEWVPSKKTSRPKWGKRNKIFKTRDKYIANAREKIGERWLGTTAFFSIKSENDKNYLTPQLPNKVDRLYVSAGKSRTTGDVFDIDYFIYSYIELPSPMKNGTEYQITVGDSDSVKFTFDDKTTISRAIKINQLGYLPDAGSKRAYLGAYLYRFGPMDLSHVDRFEVIDVSTGEVAFIGQVELLEKNPRFASKKKSGDSSERPMMYGEDVYVADFTGLREEGVFFISVPGVGRSWPFRHDKSVYGPAFYTTIRGLYHQRAGLPVKEKYSPWTRVKVSRGPYCESENVFFPLHTGGPKGYKRFDVIGATIDCSQTTEEIPGGWHDAADWDSNLAHFTVIFDLLNAFSFYPDKFIDGQLNIPESGNGVPDILDEVRFGLEIWRHSMDEHGGVSGMLETWTHHKKNDKKIKYAFSQRTRWSSLIFAAAAAQYAQHVAPFDSRDSRLYQEAALKAFKFGNNKANSLGKTTIHAKTKRGKGESYKIEWEETEDHIKPYLLHAKIRLYLLTKNKSYLDGVWEQAEINQKPDRRYRSRKSYFPWVYYSLLEVADVFPKLLETEWRKRFLDDADKLLEDLNQMPYAITWPRKQDYWMAWGASYMTNFNRALFIAYKLTGEKKYRDAAIKNTDFMFGANPLGMSWTTGIGYVYPIDIQHGVSGGDGIFDPVPGISIYGTTGGPIYHKFREKVWQSPSQDRHIDFVSHDSQRKPPLWRRWMVHPHFNVAQNEFTIQETMSSTIFSAAMLMNNNWKPDKSLIDNKPRSSEYLFGRWYLP